MADSTLRNKIFIGDNLTVLNNPTMSNYVGKIRMIYIDPPYNTGNYMSYSDKVKSTEWLDNIVIRVKSSLKYLSDDGVIFISIDDNEYANLKVECDKIFGKENFIGTFITNQSKRSNSKLINIVHEYILCYSKSKKKVKPFKVKRIDIPEDKKMIENIIKLVKENFNTFGKEVALKTLSNIINKECLNKNITWLKNYNCIDDKGEVFFAVDLSTPSKPRVVNIPSINLHLNALPTRGWVSDNRFIDLSNKGLLCFKGDRPYEVHYLKDAEENVSSILPFYSRQGKHNLVKLGLRDSFDTPKPVEMIKYLIRICSCENDIILDYYAGSGTTAQATYETNLEDKRNNTYILIQSEEEVQKNSIVYNSCNNLGIKPIVSEILKLRIDTYLEQNKIEKDYTIQYIK